MRATTLYRLYNDADELLYVGIAGNPGRRFEQHAADKAWWQEVATIRCQHFPTREDAEEAERSAIREERPRRNVTHNRPLPEPIPENIADDWAARRKDAMATYDFLRRSPQTRAAVASAQVDEARQKPKSMRLKPLGTRRRQHSGP